ncbi:hypothetical protein FORC065_0143 [Yersinia enterocolitica]|nr:hypothetical protein FORC065_0143 [Yersinia enterocolitica]
MCFSDKSNTIDLLSEHLEKTGCKKNDFNLFRIKSSSYFLFYADF